MELDPLPDTDINQTAGWRKATLCLAVLIVIGAIVLAEDGIWAGTIVLGYVDVGWSQETAIPFPAIAGRIAERARVMVGSRGGVDGGGQFQATFRGGPDRDAVPVSPDALARSRARTARIWKITAAAILILIAARMAFRVLG